MLSRALLLTMFVTFLVGCPNEKAGSSNDMMADSGAVQNDLSGSEDANTTDQVEGDASPVEITEPVDTEPTEDTVPALDTGDSDIAVEDAPTDPLVEPTEVTFSVDMNCSGLAEFKNVSVGVACGDECSGCHTLSDPDKDGVWTGSFLFEAGAILEYTYLADDCMVPEDLDDDIEAGADCAQSADPDSYAYRKAEVVSGLTLNDTYGTCDVCNEDFEYTLTFQVQMEPGYQGGVTVGNSVQGWDTAGVIQLTDPDGDGLYVGNVKLKAGTFIEYKFIKGYDGGGTWEDVPLDCGLKTGDYINRFFTMPAAHAVLDATPYSGCPDDGPKEGVCSDKAGREVAVTTLKAKVMVGNTPIHMKGVAWSPVPKGQAPGSGGSDFAGYVEQDALLMANAGINVVRTYGPILDKSVLDKLWSHGIYVLMTVYYGYADTPDTAVANVCAVKSHPAILGWVVGNEWNYANLNKDISFDQAVNEVKAVVSAIKLNDTTRPVSTIYGGLPPAGVLQKLSNVDVWGSNHYPGLSFGNFFKDWKALSDKPMYFGEYGADAYDGTVGAVDEDTQADIVSGLTQEIHDNASVNGSGVCAGGMVFEFNDEWWKKNGGGWSEHDTDASWQNGAYPDPNMNEEWWGLVDIDRNPRKAYEAYKELVAPSL
jgi:hypothetical protein